MTVPEHSLCIFQRPKEGSGFIKRVSPIFNYRHSITAQGWFDTASCDVAVRSQGEGQEYLDRYLGCRVFVFADNPFEPIWEGFINRISFNAGGASFSIGLDEMANRVEVKYSNDSVTVNGLGTIVTTTIANSTKSQAIYGIKHDSVEFGYNRNGNAAHANTLRDTILAQRAFPQTSITKGGQNSNLVTLECLGFFHTLEWEVLAFASATTTNFDARIKTDFLPALGNGTTFFDNADFADIAANAIATTGTVRNGQTYWDAILKIAEAGDASNYWITGIGPTNPQTGKRRLYYKQVNAATEYIARLSDGLQVRNIYGRLVPPWTVRPDRSILISDVLVGFNSAVTTDPRLTYISRIEYDANQQNVQWFGADDTTMAGAFMLKQGFRSYGKKFFGGAGLRVVS
jgi:hypothetical protein